MILSEPQWTAWPQDIRGSLSLASKGENARGANRKYIWRISLNLFPFPLIPEEVLGGTSVGARKKHHS